MKKIYIRGNVPLNGQVRIQGSKNAALPILAATLLAKGEHEIKNCPKIADVYYMLDLMRSQGAVVNWKGRDIYVDTRNLVPGVFKENKEGSMRSSIFLLGAMLGRFGEADLEYPGGCIIGERPVDWHITHLNKMGVVFEEDSQRIIAKTNGLKGCGLYLPFPSVGVTENLIMAATMAEGITKIHGAAKEPEIITLCEFLTSAGARIFGAGKADIVIEGVSELHGGSITLPGDRIVAGTYALACMATGGGVLLEGAPLTHMNRLIPMLHAMGGETILMEEGMYLCRRQELTAIPYTVTEVYPGFPTDLQSPLMAVLCMANGDSAIEERIFDNRFRIVPQLRKMGADIHIIENTAYIRGVDKLQGRYLYAEELRGGAALVIAGLGASGETHIENCNYIYRGYENICRDFSELGARIYSE
jgi:UDP-N-acetylglucosamine 1-carboxyvinyltransferase